MLNRYAPTELELLLKHELENRGERAVGLRIQIFRRASGWTAKCAFHLDAVERVRLNRKLEWLSRLPFGNCLPLHTIDRSLERGAASRGEALLSTNAMSRLTSSSVHSVLIGRLFGACDQRGAPQTARFSQICLLPKGAPTDFFAASAAFVRSDMRRRSFSAKAA